MLEDCLLSLNSDIISGMIVNLNEISDLAKDFLEEPAFVAQRLLHTCLLHLGKLDALRLRLLDSGQLQVQAERFSLALAISNSRACDLPGDHKTRR